MLLPRPLPGEGGVRVGEGQGEPHSPGTSITLVQGQCQNIIMIAVAGLYYYFERTPNANAHLWHSCYQDMLFRQT